MKDPITGAEIHSLKSEGTWCVYSITDTKAASWDGNNWKVIKIPIQSGQNNTESVALTGDVTITDRVYIGSSVLGSYKQTTNGSLTNYDLPDNTTVKLSITNGTDHDVTISQYIWGSKHITEATDENGKIHKQGVDNNCMFTVWCDCELEIIGKPNARIIIDGGCNTTAATSDWSTITENINGHEPYKKIVWGLLESNGKITLKHVTIRNVKFSEINAKSDACECSCIKLHSNAETFKLGNTVLEDVIFENVESPGGGGCILTCYKDLRVRSENTRDNSKVTIKDCQVLDSKQNIHDGSGLDYQGLIRFNEYFTGDVMMDNCKFLRNGAQRGCAGIMWETNVGKDGSGFEQPLLTINNGLYENNTSYRGTAVYIKNGRAVMTGEANFLNNEATTGEGGAMIVDHADLTVENATFDGNKAPNSNGGAIRLMSKCNLTISNDAIFQNNYAGQGGAVYAHASDATIGNATFQNNYSTDWGGALVGHTGTITISGIAKFIGNYSTGAGGGGAIKLVDSFGSGASTLKIKDRAEFTENHANIGGAIYAIESSVAEISKATFKNNYATEWGGAIASNKSSISIKDEALFEGNHADGNNNTGGIQYSGGGAITAYYKTTMKINNATFRNNYTLPSDNNAGRGGAIFYYLGGARSGTNCLEIDNAKFDGNKAKAAGGALFFMNDWTTEANSDYQEVLIKNATFTNNVGGAGGAIGVDGARAAGETEAKNIKIVLENNNIENNWAAIGGGLAIQEGAVEYKGGVIRNNRAWQRMKKDLTAGSADETIETSDGTLKKSGYGYVDVTDDENVKNARMDFWNYNNRSTGYGGGIATHAYGKFTFDATAGRFGIYNNIAQQGGDDILSSGSDGGTTSITLPDLQSSSINLDGFNIAPIMKKSLYWMEDYNKEEDNYSVAVHHSGNSASLGRYRDMAGNADTKRQVSNMSIANGTYTGYVAATLGYIYVYATIEKTGLKKGESSIFELYNDYNASSPGNPYITVVITNKDGDENTACSRVVALPAGNWTVKETDWAYTYDTADGYSKLLNHDFTTDKSDYTFKFKNVKKGADRLVPSAEDSKQNPDMKKE